MKKIVFILIVVCPILIFSQKIDYSKFKGSEIKLNQYAQFNKSTLSDYGENLGKTRHPLSEPIEQFQKEVLMEEGYFKQISEPIPFTGSDGTKWYYIDFEELGKPLN